MTKKQKDLGKKHFKYRINSWAVMYMGAKRLGYTELGKQIKKRLIDKDMTARQLADALGITPQYMNKILHGERSGEKYIKEIKRILDIAA